MKTFWKIFLIVISIVLAVGIIFLAKQKLNAPPKCDKPVIYAFDRELEQSLNALKNANNSDFDAMYNAYTTLENKIIFYNGQSDIKTHCNKLDSITVIYDGEFCLKLNNYSNLVFNKEWSLSEITNLRACIKKINTDNNAVKEKKQSIISRCDSCEEASKLAQYNDFERITKEKILKAKGLTKWVGGNKTVEKGLNNISSRICEKHYNYLKKKINDKKTNTNLDDLSNELLSFEKALKNIYGKRVKDEYESKYNDLKKTLDNLKPSR